MSRRRIALFSVAVMAISLLAAPTAMAKKKSKNVFSKQVTVNAPVPDPAPASVSTALISTITVPKQFKGREVADVNVTNFQTTGTGATAATTLTAYLTSPSGRTLQLFLNPAGSSLGPWTLDDDSPIAICIPSPNPCRDPSQGLYPPYAGTSNLSQNWIGNFNVNGGLYLFNRQAMRGVWTLRVIDVANASGTSVLNQWGLRIQAKGKK
jgi:hypothetical protein